MFEIPLGCDDFLTQFQHILKMPKALKHVEDLHVDHGLFNATLFHVILLYMDHHMIVPPFII